VTTLSMALRSTFVALAAAVSLSAAAPEPDRPKDEPKEDKDSVRFGVIGDSGSGDAAQFRVAEELAKAHQHWPLDFIIMLGDNIYGEEAPEEYAARFEKPYKALLDAGVPFYAALGNHDHPNQRFYRHFNMEGKRYYTFEGKGASVRLFALDTNYMDPEQLAWLKKEACGSSARWKIPFFHHPIYSSGSKHGSSPELQRILEPVFAECGIDVVFAGHDHFYERVKPQRDILYFVSGGAGKLRAGNIKKDSRLTEVGFDQGYHFLVAEIVDDVMRFTTLSDRGKVIDAGEWRAREAEPAAGGEKTKAAAESDEGKDEP
jgi:predicted phosphodiesterase